MDEVEILINRLKDGEYQSRAYSAYLLGERKDARAVPALIEALKDDNATVRWSSIRALGTIKDNSTVPVLVELLEDDNKEMREEAIWALGAIGDASALIEALKNEKKDVRNNAAVALRSIGVPAVPVLIDALKDKNKYVRVTVASVLKGIVENCATVVGLEYFEKQIEEASTTLRKGRVDKTILINAQIEVAKLTRVIAKRKELFAPKRDLLLDDKPKPPKKDRGVYHAAGRMRNG